MSWLFEPSSFPIEDLIEKATSEHRTSENWQMISLIYEAIKSDPKFIKLAVDSLKKRLSHRDPHVVILALSVLDACWANCGPAFRRAVASRDFINELESNCTTHYVQQVGEKAHSMVKKWVDAEMTEDSLGLMSILYQKYAGEAPNKTTHASSIAPDTVAPALEHQTSEEKNASRKIRIDTSLVTESFDELTDECCCSLCCEIFDSAKYIPRSVDCGHVYCEVCIYNKKIRIENVVKCPMCQRETDLPDGRELPINYPLIGISEKLMRSRIDPQIGCKACEMMFPPSSVRVCIAEDCVMYNELLCLSCALDGGHGGHVVKYDVKLKKMAGELREEVANICSQVDDKKQSLMQKARELTEITSSLEASLSEANIPAQIIEQLDTIASEQEAEDLREIVNDLANTLMNGCNAVEEAFDNAIKAANQQFELLDSKSTDGEING